MLPPTDALLVSSKLLETEELVEVRSPSPVMLLLDPVIEPPKVKAFRVRVPPPVDWMVLVPPPKKVNPPPELVTLIPADELMPTAVTVFEEVMDLVISREPAKVDEAVPLPMKLPNKVRLPDEARVRSAVLAPLSICNDSEAVPVLVAWIKNLF